jgi:predicted DNA-binding ribbon-helix-helix protein
MTEQMIETPSPTSRRGRPREISGQGERVSTWVSLEQYERLMEVAKREEMSVCALLRHLLIVVLGPRP